MPSSRVVLVDDHPPIREGISAIVERSSDFTVVSEAGTLAEALVMMEAERADLAIVDITLPDGSGMDLIRRIKLISPDTRTLVVTMHASRQMADAAFSAGADGYLLKESGGETILAGMREVIAGRSVLDPKLRTPETPAGCHDNPGERMGLELLTTREMEVFSHLAVGRKSHDIADLLTISPKTVDNHRASIMEKLCVGSVAEIARIAIRTGVIDP